MKPSLVMKPTKSIILLITIISYLAVFSVSCSAQNTSKPAISDKIFENTIVRMTWQEIKEAADKKAIVLVPISIVEEHGPHMDLSSDIILGTYSCSIMKESLEKDGIPTVIAPPCYWGISLTTNFLPGTFNIKESTLKLLLSEIVDNMTRWGFEKFYFVSSHGDPAHNGAISRIAESLNSSKTPKVYDLSALPDAPNPISIPSETPGMFKPDYHAGANETKIIWSIEPSIIRKEIAGTLKPQNTFAPLGYAGDPASFMRSRGDDIFEALVKSFAQRIKYQLSTTDNTKKK